MKPLSRFESIPLPYQTMPNAFLGIIRGDWWICCDSNGPVLRVIAQGTSRPPLTPSAGPTPKDKPSSCWKYSMGPHRTNTKKIKLYKDTIHNLLIIERLRNTRWLGEVAKTYCSQSETHSISELPKLPYPRQLI